MSITAETAQAHKDDPAVLCCRLEKGSTIEVSNLEDPAIFDDLVDSGLLKLEGALTIGQALGTTLEVTGDSLCPITSDMVSGLSVSENEAKKDPSPLFTDGILKIHIGEGKEIDIELPIGRMANAPAIPAEQVIKPVERVIKPAEQVTKEAREEKPDRIKRTLKNMKFAVKKINIGEETKFENGILTVRSTLVKEALEVDPLVVDMEMDVITPDDHQKFTNSMMDICPIAVKAEGKIGEGITYELKGAVMMLTGVDEAGKQVSDANASDGIIAENIKFGRPGCPDEDDIILRIHVTIKDGYRMERPGPYAAHKAADHIVEEIRHALKLCKAEDAVEVKIYEDIERPSKPRVLIVKEIMGQGAMHDNLILPNEPAGFLGGRPNVDLGNLPVLLTPNEILDGGIHALTCITPDTKETTRAYWREPFVERAANDPEFNFVGVILIGSPQVNTEKFYVSERLGRWVEVLNLQGAIVTTEGFGNNHIDFASHIEQIGSLDIPVVGVSFCGVQGALVVGNKHMDAMVDLCVTADGGNSDRLSDNSVTPEAALRAVAMLKDKMMGVPIKKAEKSWVEAICDTNLEHAKESHHDN